jgi:hypothetical protein
VCGKPANVCSLSGKLSPLLLLPCARKTTHDMPVEETQTAANAAMPRLAPERFSCWHIRLSPPRHPNQCGFSLSSHSTDATSPEKTPATARLRPTGVHPKSAARNAYCDQDHGIEAVIVSDIPG